MLQGSGATEKFATPVPFVEVAQKETLEHCGDRKGQKGNGGSRSRSNEAIDSKVQTSKTSAYPEGAILNFGLFGVLLTWVLSLFNDDAEEEVSGAVKSPFFAAVTTTYCSPPSR